MAIPPGTTQRPSGVRSPAVVATDIVLAAMAVLVLVGGFLALYTYHYTGEPDEVTRGFSYGGPSSIAVALIIGALGAVHAIGVARLPRWSLAALSLVGVILVLGEMITFDSEHGHLSRGPGWWLLVVAVVVELLASVVGAFAERSAGSASSAPTWPAYRPATTGPAYPQQQPPPPPGGWSSPQR